MGHAKRYETLGDLNPFVDTRSDNAKGYITQRIVMATQRIDTATRRTGVGDSANRDCGLTKRHLTLPKDIRLDE